jgi:hypothetical protein
MSALPAMNPSRTWPRTDYECSRAIGAAVTSFFLPGLLPGVEEDRAYAELRAEAEERIGCGIRATRIYSLSARREGTDSEIRVGEADPCSGATVRAIFATQQGYTVIWDHGNVDLTSRQVYEAVPFE